jgi:hypothetical protein
MLLEIRTPNTLEEANAPEPTTKERTINIQSNEGLGFRAAGMKLFSGRRFNKQ